MIELYLVVFLACGHPVFVIMQPIDKPMKVYSQESMGKERWPSFLKIVEASKDDPGVARLELLVEDQVPIACTQAT